MSVRAHERWQAFLNQIKERHGQICAEADEGAREALRESGFDPHPISVAWMAIDNRLHDLERKIIDTWHEKVDDTFEAEGYPPDERNAARARGEELAFELENDRQLAEMRVFAYGAREVHARALAAQKERSCPHCGAPLDIPMTYQAVHASCTHCKSLSTFEPGMLARSALAFGSHALSWESAHQEWLVMRRAERAMKKVRPPAALALIKDYERAQIAYWTRYFTTKAVLEPVVADVQREVRARLESWYTMGADHEAEWVRAGRPRELR